MALVGEGSIVSPEFHLQAGDILNLARAKIDFALKPGQEIIHAGLDILVFREDLGQFIGVGRVVGPLLGLLHGHQQAQGGVGVLLHPVGAHGEGLLRVILPELTGDQGGITQLLIHQALVPGLAHAEDIHGARLHVGHHLRRRDHHQVSLFVGVDAIGRQPVAHP